jgi:pimeloyl-ACP methyl ester carboxylesterase
VAKIVLVHGAFHELWGPHEIAARWVPALRDGLWHHGAEITERDVDVAFYGDYFRPDPETMSAADVEAAQHAGELNLTEQLPGGAEMLPALADAIGQRMLDRIEYLTGVLGQQPDVKDRCIARVTEQLGADTRVVVSHSLGTVVTVMALERNPGFELPLLVTLGSPLGAPFLQERLERDGALAAWPGGVQRWVNVAAVADRACIEPRLARCFGSRVEDHLENNGHRAHDVEPYLNASVTGAAIAEALRGEGR